MHIDFVRTGGFAGMRLKKELDTTELDEERAAEIRKLVGEADFFELPDRLVPESPGPDRFEYRVTITSKEKVHSVLVHEAVAPEALRPLLEYLTSLAMEGKKPQGA